MAAISGSQSWTRVGWSSTTLSVPLAAGCSTAARIAVATSWAWMKENSAVPSPISGSLPARSRRANQPSGAKLEPGPYR
jgi:hypothetical protein